MRYCDVSDRMDALTLGRFLSPILSVTTVWNTGETGDINITSFIEKGQPERLHFQENTKDEKSSGQKT